MFELNLEKGDKVLLKDSNNKTLEYNVLQEFNKILWLERNSKTYTINKVDIYLKTISLVKM